MFTGVSACTCNLQFCCSCPVWSARAFSKVSAIYPFARISRRWRGISGRVVSTWIIPVCQAMFKVTLCCIFSRNGRLGFFTHFILKDIVRSRSLWTSIFSNYSKTIKHFVPIIEQMLKKGQGGNFFVQQVSFYLQRFLLCPGEIEAKYGSSRLGIFWIQHPIGPHS